MEAGFSKSLSSIQEEPKEEVRKTHVIEVDGKAAEAFAPKRIKKQLESRRNEMQRVSLEKA
jgi:hypothetical protein